MIAAILRFFSYAYNTLISLAMLALGIVACMSDLDLKLDMLPWTGQPLTYWLIGLGGLGLLIVVCAFFGILRWLILLWSLAVLGVFIRALLFTGWSFDGQTVFQWALEAFGAYLLSLFGAISIARQGNISRA